MAVGDQTPLTFFNNPRFFSLPSKALWEGFRADSYVGQYAVFG